MRNHGYGLRNYLVLMKYAEVIEALAASRQDLPAPGRRVPRSRVFWSTPGNGQ